MMMPKQVGFHFKRHGVALVAAAAALVLGASPMTRAQTVTAPLSVSTFAGAAGTRQSTDGTGTLARFYGPAGIAIDNSGNLIVADACNELIRRITPAGVVTTIAGQPVDATHPSNVGHSDGTGASASFHMGEFQSSGGLYDPPNFARSGSNTCGIDGSGNIYIADTNNYTVRRVTSTGVVTTIAGSFGVLGTLDGNGTSARFLSPGGTAVDSSGNVFVTDSGNDTIRKIAPNGDVTTFAGTAHSFGSADGTGSAAQFTNPEGIVVDGSNNLYVTDTGNHTVRKITPAGVVTTFAGSPGQSGTADGNAAQARFNGPLGIAIDASGNLYVADTGNNAIRKISPTGTVTTIAGNKSTSGSTDGVGTAALFNAPTGIAVDSSGVVYIADFSNNTIRRGVTASTSGSLAISTIPPVLVQVAGTSSLSLKLTATGSPSPTYQWYKNGAAISGATNATLSINSVVSGDAGNYTIQVNSDVLTYNSGVTNVAVFALGTAVPVTIITQPADRSVGAGQSTTFSVEAVSPTGLALSYQWKLGGVAISGATNSTYNIASAQTANIGSYSVTVTDGVNQSNTTAAAALAVTGGSNALAPTFTASPVSQTVLSGASVTLAATATGTPTPTYQWQKDGTNLTNGATVAGATTTSLTISNFAAANAGNYTLIATNSAGNATSSVAALTLAGAPTFTTQPQSQTGNVGATVTFTAAASGTPTPTYQWQKEGANLSNSATISGAMTASLTITGVAASDAGNYTVVATNVVGSATSGTATLTVGSASNRGRLTNLSINTGLSTNEQITMSFVVGGAGTTGTKPLLLRAMGPSLAQWYPTTYLPDPAFDFYNDTVVIDSNDDWGGSSALSNIATSVGAFSFVSPTSKDAALYKSAVITGAHSMIISGKGGSGEVIGEVYDTTPSAQYTDATPRLINVSVNKNIGDVTTAGFYVNGSQPLRVLIRAVGPGLAQWVNDFIPDPKMTVYDGNNVAIDGNDNWDATVTPISAQSSVGAFPLTVGSKDAVLIETLNPGAYTVQVKASTGATGRGLIEVYEMP